LLIAKDHEEFKCRKAITKYSLTHGVYVEATKK